MSSSPARPSRWDVERAVKRSSLTPSARLIVWTLASRTVAGTAEIPAQHSPSLTELTRETGLGRTTVARLLRDELEPAGWVLRDQPSKPAQLAGAHTVYRLAVPVDPAAGAPAPSPGLVMAPEESRPSATTAPALVPSRSTPSATTARVVRPSDLPETTTAAAARADAPADASERSGDLVAVPDPTIGEQIVTRWAEGRPGILPKQRATLAVAVNKLLHDGALPELVPAALDEAQDNPDVRSPAHFMAHAYDNVRRARQREQTGARGALQGQQRPGGRPSRMDRARAAAASVQARYGPDPDGRPELLQLPPTGSDR